jgi:hypothetical protein
MVSQNYKHSLNVQWYPMVPNVISNYKRFKWYPMFSHLVMNYGQMTLDESIGYPHHCNELPHVFQAVH